MFTVAIYEDREELAASIRKHLDKLGFEMNMRIAKLTMSRLPSPSKRSEYFPQVMLALLSMDMPDVDTTAEELYRFNQDCRIIFYSDINRDIVPLLRVRPIGFFVKQKHEKAEETMAPVAELLPFVVSDIRRYPGTFIVENKERIYFLRTERIRYFQSDLKNVSIHYMDAEPIVMVRKMSEILQSMEEQEIQQEFIRIHQSFVVNKSHILCIDKRQRVVELTNGEKLPISDSKYENVKRILSEKC